MKKILPLIGCLLIIANISAEEYKILKLNTESIKIGKKICRKDSTFNDSWTIEWTSPKQCMTVQNVQDHTIAYLSGAAMQSRNTRTAKDYLVHDAQLSGKDGEHWLSFSAMHEDDYTDRRIALVIGNSNYKNHTKLKNPLNDVTAVAEQLQLLGFEVICLYDATIEDMNNALDLFRQRAVREKFDFALFYYSGHGLQYDSKNWLMPVEAHLEHPSDLTETCMEGQELLSLIDDTKCGNKVVILDACRTDKINWKDAYNMKQNDEHKSFVSMEPRRGMLLAYSTRSGDIAQDISDANSDLGPYATALVNNLQKGGLTLDALFNEVGAEVEAMTSSTQSPIHINGIRNKWVINGKNTIVPKAAYGQQNNHSNFFTYILGLAENGDAEAQFQLGTCYEYGVNQVVVDYETAIQWYQKAAKQGHAEAKNKMGLFFFSQAKYKEALKYFKSAAKSGNLNAQYNLGMMYMNDMYGVMDVDKGLKWYKRAADGQLATAQFELGLCHFYGIGVVKNHNNAIPWFKKAANQGHDEAQYMLAQCYLMGDGVMQNYKEAFKYFQLAADQNYAPAQYGLSTCYYEGLGTEKNMDSALYWCKKAAKQGFKKAKERLQFLEPTE